MERLTRPAVYKTGAKYASAIGNGHGCWRRIIHRLAEYENTGLEPEEIEELLNKTYGPLHITIARGLELARAEKEGCVYCNSHKPLEPDGGGELQVVEIQPMPAINLTTGKKDETAPKPFMALWFRAFDGEFEDFVPIRCCPMCGRILKGRDNNGNSEE